MANEKNLPNITGDETIAKTWRRLLTRDRNTSNFFSGDDFTTDQDPVQDVGRPNWRTDLNRLFIFNGTDFISLWDYLTPQEIAYSIEHPDVPDTVQDVKAILDLLVNRNLLNTVTMPAMSQKYIGNGTTTEYDLERYTSNKNTLYVFIDGVKQVTDTYELASDGMSIIFNQAPNNGETIEILQLASLLEYDYSPFIKKFTAEEGVTEFDVGFPILNKDSLIIVHAGKVLMDADWEILPDGHTVKFIMEPVVGQEVVIRSIFKTSYVTVSANSIGTAELKDGAVTAAKLATAIPVDINNVADGSITTAKLANSVIDSTKLANNAVITSSIADKSVTKEKLADNVATSLLGTENVSTGNIAPKSITEDKLSDDLTTVIANLTTRITALEAAITNK